MFYHEFIELHAALVMALPLLEAMPNITIIVNKNLVHKQIFPLLRVSGIHPERLNFVAMKGDNSRANKHADAPLGGTDTHPRTFSYLLLHPYSLTHCYTLSTCPRTAKSFYHTYPHRQQRTYSH
jgi:hypothetical protein